MYSHILCPYSPKRPLTSKSSQNKWTPWDWEQHKLLEHGIQTQRCPDTTPVNCYTQRFTFTKLCPCFIQNRKMVILCWKHDGKRHFTFLRWFKEIVFIVNSHSLKEYSTQKWKFAEFTQPQTIQNVFEFVSEQILEKCHHLLTNGSSAVNGCRQNESPNSW